MARRLVTLSDSQLVSSFGVSLENNIITNNIIIIISIIIMSFYCAYYQQVSSSLNSNSTSHPGAENLGKCG